MKKFNSITAIIIILVFVLVSIYFRSIDVELKKQIDSLSQQQTIIKVEPIPLDTALVEKYEEVVRLNERLEMENTGMHDYIVGMGKTWDRWANENSFPKESEKE